MTRSRRNETPPSCVVRKAGTGAALLGAVLVLAPWLPLSAANAPIGLDDRVACQAALEDLRWADMIWPESNPDPKPPREEVLGDALIRERVIDRLRMEHALEALHGVRLETRDLQAEIDRMVLQTRAPDRLLERFRALGDDPRQIAECMARPELVRKELIRRHRVDGKQNAPHSSWDTAAFEQWWVENRNQWSPRIPSAPGSLRLPDTTGSKSVSKAAVADTWHADHFPIGRISHNAIWTGTEMIVLGGGAVRWDGWSRYDPATDTWKAVSTIDGPDDGIADYFSIWTGTEVLSPGLLGDDWFIFRYDPAADVWREPFPLVGLPSFDALERLVWTGTELLFLGAAVSPGWGLRFRPESGEWMTMAADNAPGLRFGASIVSTRDHLIVWGGHLDGSGFQTGGRYDFASDLWEPTTTVNAPEGRVEHSAVWTGSEMIVIGGRRGSHYGSGEPGDAARYDPTADSWIPLSLTGAPGLHTLVKTLWTGEELIVFDAMENIGGRYSPTTDSWQDITSAGWIGRRYEPGVVWTGEEMIVWGGVDIDAWGDTFGGEVYADSGARYDPDTDTWTPTSKPALTSRTGASVVWTGSEMLVWGGYDTGAFYHYPVSGARYDPVTHTWVGIPKLTAFTGRSGAASVWTGKEMVVWGGVYWYSTLFGSWPVPLGDGARYDPLLDSWTATSDSGSPSARYAHSAVWTGTEMLIWGGSVTNPPGARYDPAEDAWLPISISNAPVPTRNHSAIWTGDEMIVWHPGGTNQGASGGRYSPEHDLWSPINTTGSPRTGTLRSAVWTGEELIVVGRNPDNSLIEGAGYAPASDEWTPISTPQPPAGQHFSSAIWTGSQIIIWGGSSTAGHTPSLRSGIAYDPRTDSWDSIADAPLAKEGHHAIWTGREMIVWGGYGHGGTLTYFPKSDTRTRIVASTPNPTMPGLPVRVRVHVTAADSAPTDGQVQLSSSEGAACLDIEPQTFDAQTAVFECALVFGSLGTHRVDALFSASQSHYDSDTLHNLEPDASSLVTVLPLIEPVFADGFE